ncbi:MAG: cation:proton antiporter [Pseudomonadota bacterium]
MTNALLITMTGFIAVLVAMAAIPVVAPRVALPVGTLQAMLGTGLGTLALALGHPQVVVMPALEGLLDTLLALGGPGILALFLPPLLFDAALRVDTRMLTRDLAAVLLLAVVAVLVTTLLVAGGLTLTTSLPLLWALALGAIVATTDPSAVLAVFKQVGAPRRLQALVEGESLLNDAAAIVLFAAVVELLGGAAAAAPGGIAADFAATFVGGGLLGAAIGLVAGFLIARLPTVPEAALTLCVATPYVTFLMAELALGISGVVAVVVSGLVVGRALQIRVRPALTREILNLWGQLAAWAGGLIVIGATILVPVTLLPDRFDLFGLAIVVLGCLIARALVLYGLLPVIVRLGWTAPVSGPFKLAMLWGGLRGAVTIALALTLAADASLPLALRDQVGLLAFGLALFTLFVQAPTLPLLMRGLGLQGLSPLDAVLKDRAARAVRARLAERLAELRATLRLDSADEVEPRTLGATEDRSASESERRDRLTAAVAGITEREAERYRELFDEGFVSESAAAVLAAGPPALAEALRSSGLSALAAAAKRELSYDWRLRAAAWGYRRFRWRRPLAQALALRYEVVLVRRSVLIQLRRDIADELGRITDADAASRVDTLLSARLDAHQRALEALRVQYPDYARQLETLFLRRAALRLEDELYKELRADGLLSGAAHAALAAQVAEHARGTTRVPTIDLPRDRDAMLARIPFVERLDARSRRRLRRSLRTGLAVPGERLIRRGDHGEAMFFIVDGAVSVQWPGGRRTLGPGDVFGEIALLTGQRRTADVVALGYVQYLELRRADFRRLVTGLGDLRAEMTRLATQRERDQTALPVSRETEPSPPSADR